MFRSGEHSKLLESGQRTTSWAQSNSWRHVWSLIFSCDATSKAQGPCHLVDIHRNPLSNGFRCLVLVRTLVTSPSRTPTFWGYLRTISGDRKVCYAAIGDIFYIGLYRGARVNRIDVCSLSWAYPFLFTPYVIDRMHRVYFFLNCWPRDFRELDETVAIVLCSRATPRDPSLLCHWWF